MTTEALTKKQKQVHKLATENRLKPKAIAKAMKISVNGVYGHMRRIEEKGYDLGRGTEQPSAPASSNGSSQNGHGTVGEVDEVTGKLRSLVRERRDAIKAEVDQVAAVEAEMRERRDVLDAEDSALATREERLAAVVS